MKKETTTSRKALRPQKTLKGHQNYLVLFIQFELQLAYIFLSKEVYTSTAISIHFLKQRSVHLNATYKY